MLMVAMYANVPTGHEWLFEEPLAGCAVTYGIQWGYADVTQVADRVLFPAPSISTNQPPTKPL